MLVSLTSWQGFWPIPWATLQEHSFTSEALDMAVTDHRRNSSEFKEQANWEASRDQLDQHPTKQMRNTEARQAK